ncbi:MULTISPECIES: hypothetical protein [unclassified Xanthomonas]|uniref:hypothetical protein n=1 Tax=unclassified Xanthomonas TaxID=2643310 RepID=UPI002B22785F|nr:MULTISPECIES: hypothetical protein [unclassified Xanthomonas]MEA9566158.1 hypothetical protein [Xanthomonas sp. WHRI 8932A]MEA9635287.1 hypothetical protein [Xanthomonas sp. WHRI 8812E]
MRSLLTRLLHRLHARQANASAAGGVQATEIHAQPQIESGSTLHTIAGLDPVAAAAFADAFAVEIEHAIARCTLGAADTSQAQALEQIHSLKNTISLTGSQQLLKACDQLRGEVESDALSDTLAHRFTAVATAAGLLVKRYRRTLPIDDADPHA